MRRCVWVIRKRGPPSSTPDLEFENFSKEEIKDPSRNDGVKKSESGTPCSVVQRSNH